jgi:hypothetical protein
MGWDEAREGEIYDYQHIGDVKGKIKLDSMLFLVLCSSPRSLTKRSRFSVVTGSGSNFDPGFKISQIFIV